MIGFREIMNDDGFLAITNTTMKMFGWEKANILAVLIEQHFMMRVDKYGWFYLSYEDIMERLGAKHFSVQSAVQFFLEDGLIVRKRSNIQGKWKYQFVQDRVYALFKKKQGTTEKGDSSENLRNVPIENLMNKDKKEKKEEDKPSFKGKDSLKEGAPTDVATPSNGLVRRKKSNIVEPSIADPNEPLFPSASVEALFSHWNSLGKPLTSHKADPKVKTFLASIDHLVKALKKHPLHIIKKAMDDYYTIITNPHTELVLRRPGVKVSLPEFFKFSADTQERMIHHPILLTTKSWFEECLLGMDHLEDRFRTHERDIHPKVTEALIVAYQKKIRQENIRPAYRNNFIRAAKFIVEYHAEHRNKINWCSCPQERTSVAMFAYRLIEAVVEDAQDPMQIEPTWLCTERTKNTRLRNYLLKRGLLEQGTTPTVVRNTAPKVAPVANKPHVKKEYDPGYQPGELDLFTW